MTRKIATGKSSREIVFFEKRFEIPDYDNPTGPPSRVRWRLLHTPWFGIYLHKWLQPDPRPTLHDHPWPFLSIILLGSYVEQTIHGTRGVRWLNWTSKHKFHTVTELLRVPTWSLMFVGPTGDTWGYLNNPEWVAFDKHLHSKEFAAALTARAQDKRAKNHRPMEHWSDCAINNGPAYEPGPCDCGGYDHDQPGQDHGN